MVRGSRAYAIPTVGIPSANMDRGQTFVLVTHDPDVGAACDRIVRMRDGRIREIPPAIGPLTAPLVPREPALATAGASPGGVGS